MATTPSTQSALTIKGPGEIAFTTSVPVPTLPPDGLLVRVVAVALNPDDAKSSEYSPTLGAISGCDFAGWVVAIGHLVTRPLQVGDRVCAMVFGNNPKEPGNGAFATYVTASADLVFQIPPKMSFEEGAALACGITTCGLALYHTLGLPQPPERSLDPHFVLIYGASTATGTLAIQFVKQ